MKIAFVPRAIRRVEQARGRHPNLAAVLPSSLLKWVRRRWAIFIEPRKRWRKWLAGPATAPSMTLVGGLERGGRWLASANGVAVGLCFAWSIALYAELFSGYPEPGQKGCVLARAGARNIHAAWFMARWFMLGGGCAIVAAAAVNAHKLLWSVKHLFFAQAPLRGLSEAVPEWRMSQSAAGSLAIFQGALIFASTAILSVGTLSAMSAISTETPTSLMEWQEKYNDECRAVEQAP